MHEHRWLELLKKLASALLLPVLLLPSFMFVVPLQSVSSQSSGLSSTASSGTPLPPGNVTYQNTWNSTLVCSPITGSPEPLKASGGWTTTLRIPGFLFNGKPAGNEITQQFQLSSNGSLSVSDDSGNSFSISVPTTQFRGTTTRILFANSTTAVAETLVSTAQSLVANVTVVFSVYSQFCQPAGVRVEILGSVNWGHAGSGVIQLHFGKSPIAVHGDRAWLGNGSAEALGLDWSDSANLSPSFTAAANVVSWVVGPTFLIDPVTVGTSTSSAATEYSNQPKMCVASNQDWVFYFDGTNYVFRSSRNLSVWSAATSISTSGLKAAGDFAIYCSGSTVYRATLGPISGTSKGWYFDSGSLNAAGTITWGTEVWVESTDAADVSSGPSVAASSTGFVWVSFASLTYNRVELWRCASSCQTSTSWSDSHNIAGMHCSEVLPLSGGKMAVIFSVLNCNIQATAAVGIQTYDGSSTWSSTSSTSHSDIYLPQSSATSSANTVYMCEKAGGGARTENFTYGGSWITPHGGGGLGGSVSYCSISSGGGTNLVAFTLEGSSQVFYYTSSDGDGKWSNRFTITNSATSPTWISGALSYSNMLMAVWTEGTASPYNVRAYGAPLSIPTAALSGKSWSKPGLSPAARFRTPTTP